MGGVTHVRYTNVGPLRGHLLGGIGGVISVQTLGLQTLGLSEAIYWEGLVALSAYKHWAYKRWASPRPFIGWYWWRIRLQTLVLL